MLDLKCFLYRSIYDFKKTTQNLKTQTTFYRFVMMISATSDFQLMELQTRVCKQG